MSLVMLKVQLDQGIKGLQKQYFRLTCSFLFLKEVANLGFFWDTVPSGPLVTRDKLNRSFTLATVFSTPSQTVSIFFVASFSVTFFAGVPLVWI